MKAAGAEIRKIASGEGYYFASWGPVYVLDWRDTITFEALDASVRGKRDVLKENPSGVVVLNLMRPFEMPMPIGITPQWPRVVTAVMFQFPSYLPALAGAANDTIVAAAVRAKANIRLAIMRVPSLLVVPLVNSSIPASAQRASNALIQQ